MTKKVKLAIFDNDLKARTVKSFPISENGEQIKVVSGGEGHFMPRFDNDSFIEFPKKIWRFQIGWEKIYFARKLAKKCVNFKTPEVFIPDPEQLKRANMRLLAEKIGQDTYKGTPWYIWLTLVLNILIFYLMLQVAGVI